MHTSRRRIQDPRRRRSRGGHRPTPSNTMVPLVDHSTNDLVSQIPGIWLQNFLLSYLEFLLGSHQFMHGKTERSSHVKYYERMLRLSNTLPRCGPTVPGTSAPGSLDSRSTANLLPSSEIAGLALGAGGASTGGKSMEEEPIEGGSGRGGETAGVSLPVRDLDPTGSTPAAEVTTGSEDSTTPPLRATCSRLGRTERGSAQGAIAEVDGIAEGGRIVADVAETINGKDDILVEKASQVRVETNSAPCRVNAASDLESGAAQLAKNLCSSGTDEDSTLKAMRRASRRNLDGDLCGLKMAGPVLQSAATSPLWQSQPGYPFGDTLAFELGYPSATGISAGGCCGIATIGADGHGVFFPSTWVAI